MRVRKPKCNLLKAVNDRFLELASDFSSSSGRESDKRKYMEIGVLLQRKVYQILRESFMWEDGRFIDFNPVSFYGMNLLTQIEAKRLQRIAHNYKAMIRHMESNGLVKVSNHYCHDSRSKRFCKSYTIDKNLIRSAIDTIDEVEMVESEVPDSEMEELESLAEEAKKLKWVEYGGLRMRFDIDSAMRKMSDDFTSKQKDKMCLTFTKMRSALIAWIDRTRGHKDHVVDFRNFHFLTSMPKAALGFIYDDRGRRFKELIDLPSGNVLTTALSMYNSDEIPRVEFASILRTIFKNDGTSSIYDQFIEDTGTNFPRKFIKKCFQVVINCSDRQMEAHEKKSLHYDKRPDNVHLKTSKCVVDIQKWLSIKYPNLANNLRHFDTVPSTHAKHRMIKATYYAFTFLEKIIIEDLQKRIGTKSIRIHDAIWGFQEDDRLQRWLKEEVKELSTTRRVKFTKEGLESIFSNKVSKLAKLWSSKGRKRRRKVSVLL